MTTPNGGACFLCGQYTESESIWCSEECRDAGQAAQRLGGGMSAVEFAGKLVARYRGEYLRTSAVITEAALELRQPVLRDTAKEHNFRPRLLVGGEWGEIIGIKE